MPETLHDTSQLIKALFKLNEKDHPALLHQLIDLLNARVTNGDYNAINNELRSLEYLKKQAIETAHKTYPLLLDPVTRQPKATVTFNQYTLAWDVELTIDPKANHRLKGRPVKISLLHRSANNNFAPPDIEKMFRLKVESALSFYPTDPQFISTIRTLAGNLDPNVLAHASSKVSTFADEIKLLCRQYNNFVKAVKDHNNQAIDKYFESIIDIHDRLLTRLAVELVRKQKNNKLYNPNSIQIHEAKELIKQREIELISKQPRPVIMHAYFQESSKPKIIKAILVTCEPLSDVSSDLRTLPDDQLSNYWKVTNRSLQFNAYNKPDGSGQIYKLTPGTSIVDLFYRSASVAELIDPVLDEEASAKNKDLEAKDEDEDDQLVISDMSAESLVKKEVTVLKKMFINMAKDQLIAKLLATNSNTLNQISPKDLLVKIHFNTVLTPIVSRKFSESLAAYAGKNLLGLGNTLLKGNELEQLMSMMICFEDIESLDLKFSQYDINEIKQVLIANKFKVDAEKLNWFASITIKPRVSYSNVSVNKDPIFGLPGTALDFNNFNKQYNLSGMAKIVRNIEEFIDENYHMDSKTNNIHMVLRNLFRNTITADKNQWPALRNELAKMANDFGEPIKTIITHYIRINNHLNGISIDSHNSQIANAYMVAAADIFMLNRLLGFKVHLTCKSGKDRTGLVSLLREALIDASNNDMLIENICNALKYSTARTMNEFNVPGGKGLQIDNDILDGLKELFGERFKGQEKINAILTAQRSREVSALSRRFYRSKSAAKAWIKINPPTDSVRPKLQQPARTLFVHPKATQVMGAKSTTNTKKSPSSLMKELEAILALRNKNSRTSNLNQ